jgi:hypothetical protein
MITLFKKSKSAYEQYKEYCQTQKVIQVGKRYPTNVVFRQILLTKKQLIKKLT